MPPGGGKGGCTMGKMRFTTSTQIAIRAAQTALEEVGLDWPDSYSWFSDIEPLEATECGGKAYLKQVRFYAGIQVAEVTLEGRRRPNGRVLWRAAKVRYRDPAETGSWVEKILTRQPFEAVDSETEEA